MTHVKRRKRRKDIELRILNGATYREVAEDFRLSVAYVQQECRHLRERHPAIGCRQISPPPELERIRALAEAGCVLVDICQELDLPYGRISKLCRRYAIPIAQTGGRSCVLSVLKMLLDPQDFTQAKIAKRVCVSRQRVQQIHKEALELGLLNNQEEPDAKG